MSGIAGVLLRESAPPAPPQALDRMARALGAGTEHPALILEGGRLGLVARGGIGVTTGLASRRLGDREAALAFHGRLLGRAESGRSAAGAAPARPDADFLESLLDVLIRRGPDAVASLRGEFALAFWDGRAAALHLATDRFRVQTLLITSGSSEPFLFSSRMRPLLAVPEWLTPAVHPQSVLDVVGSSVIATPRTILRGVEKVPPGHRLSLHEGRMAIAPYWDVDFTLADGIPPARLEEDLRDALDAAVRDRLAGDRAVLRHGAFLSGGIDSSTVLGILARHDEERVPAFSIGFGVEGYDELRYARIAARAFGARHQEYYVTPADVAAALEPLADAFDEPFANASAVPTFYCARLARERGIDVLYAGDGGDELFAGNERYATSRIFERYGRIPSWIRAPIVTPAVHAAGALVPLPIFDKARKYVRRASLPPAERIVSYGFWHQVAPRAFVTESFLDSAGDYRPDAMTIWHHGHARARDELDRQLYMDLKITISDNDLLKVTRACEQAGVGVRFPFLDERVVEVAERIPARLKMRGGRLRSFFKDAYRDLLPLEIREKRKHGFGLPISLWLRSDPTLNGMMRDLVAGERAQARGYFRREAIQDLLRRHEQDPTPYYGTVLWNLMVLEVWHRRALDGERA